MKFTYAHIPSNTFLTLLGLKVWYVSTRCMGCAFYVSITWLRDKGTYLRDGYIVTLHSIYFAYTLRRNWLTGPYM